ncbi:acyl carrier protein [Cohnella sp. WQ 127256]|uniref:acyl carrier protein n=1 Tax=Cohnella sp. WQ 127256 TaxID=2938790 RepID=UPI0021172D3F|nr:acyl carrier protein [Cohnella sp. WQ 127256]
MNDELKNETALILSEVLNITISPGENPRRIEIANWDSLNHMELILRLEEKFQVRFTMGEVAAIQSLDDLVHIIGVKS